MFGYDVEFEPGTRLKSAVLTVAAFALVCTALTGVSELITYFTGS